MGWLGLGAQEELFWNKFSIGQNVQLILSMALRDIYLSTIIDIDKYKMAILIPHAGNTVLDIPPRTGLIVKVFSEGGVFQFASKVIRQEGADPNTINIEKPRHIEHIQMRKFFRLNTLLTVEYAVLLGRDVTVYSLEKIIPHLTGITRDISEGGIKLVIDRAIPADSLIKLRVNLAPISPNTWIEAIGKVLTQQPIERKSKFVTRIQFITISEEDKDIIRRLAIINTKRT